jgi:glycosyltransferase involved in cell wall biosynthesis
VKTTPQQSTLLITSEGFPPLLDASAVLVNNIFSKYKGKLYAVAGTNFTKYDPTFKAPCKTWYIRYPRTRVFEAISRRYHQYFLPLYYFIVLRIAKKVKPTVVFANYPHEVLFVATYKAAKKLNLPLFIYMHDLWEENMTRPNRKQFAARWEKEIFMYADKVICCTKAQQEYYEQKYGISSELVLHPIPDEEIDQAPVVSDVPNKKVTIAYSGSLSGHMNQDAFVEMSRAMDLLGDSYEMIWYPVNEIPVKMLESIGITSNRIRLEYIGREKLNAALNAADILFAPLSHKNCSLHEVMTVFSNKLLGYLISEKPILVFGPENCHHVNIARQGAWGYTVTEDSPEALAEGIRGLAQNPALCSSLVQHAKTEAQHRRASRFADMIQRWVDQYTLTP